MVHSLYSFLVLFAHPKQILIKKTVVRIISDSEQNARFQLTADYRLLPLPCCKNPPKFYRLR